MAIIHDLRCTNDHFLEDVRHEVDVLPPCWCGAETRVTWESGQAPAGHVFHDTVIEGKTFQDKTQLDLHRASVARNIGVPVSDIQVESDSRARRKATAEFHRHRAAEKRRKAGIDERQWKEVQTSIKTRGIDPRVA